MIPVPLRSLLALSALVWAAPIALAGDVQLETVDVAHEAATFDLQAALQICAVVDPALTVELADAIASGEVGLAEFEDADPLNISVHDHDTIGVNSEASLSAVAIGLLHEFVHVRHTDPGDIGDSRRTGNCYACVHALMTLRSLELSIDWCTYVGVEYAEPERSLAQCEAFWLCTDVLEIYAGQWDACKQLARANVCSCTPSQWPRPDALTIPCTCPLH